MSCVAELSHLYCLVLLQGITTVIIMKMQEFVVKLVSLMGHSKERSTVEPFYFNEDVDKP